MPSRPLWLSVGAPASEPTGNELYLHILSTKVMHYVRGTASLLVAWHCSFSCSIRMVGINKEWCKYHACTTLVNIKMEQMLFLMNKGVHYLCAISSLFCVFDRYRQRTYSWSCMLQSHCPHPRTEGGGGLLILQALLM